MSVTYINNNILAEGMSHLLALMRNKYVDRLYNGLKVNSLNNIKNEREGNNYPQLNSCKKGLLIVTKAA